MHKVASHGAFLCVGFILLTAQGTPARASPPPSESGAGREFVRQVLAPLPGDQRNIWTGPLRLNRRRAAFWSSAAAVTTTLVLLDQRSYRETTETFSAGLRKTLGGFSRSGHPAYMFGLAGSLWLLGNAESRSPLRRTALLTTRALIDDMVTAGVLKVAIGRQRPPGDSFGGLPDGIRSSRYRSLPSGHASATWTVAAVVSSRHRQRWVPYLAYGLAGAISFARVTGGWHYYGDVVAGALIGHGIGKMVASRP
jgi:hypothetical protein